MSDISLSDFSDNQEEIISLRDVNVRLQAQLRQAKAKVDRLVEASYQGAFDAMISLGPVRSIRPPKTKESHGRPEVALLHSTDWQLGKVTPSYNTEICRQRVTQFFHKVAKITDIQRTNHPVKECVIAFGGDMLEGVSFQFPTQPFEIDSTLFAQFVEASRLMVDVVTFALSIYDKVTVVAEWGNHGRIGSKRDAVPRSDNLDRMCFHLARQLLGNQHRLVWEDSVEDIQRIEIGNYRALLIHGDEVGRGGFASPNTIAQHVNRWKAGAYDWNFVDCYVGHFHNSMELSLADGTGAVFWTGSTESENRYARDGMAASATPSQRLHFIDPEKGRVTAQYRIILD